MSSNTECVTGEYHNIKVYSHDGSGRSVLVVLICTVCGATSEAELYAEDGDWCNEDVENDND